MARRAWSPAEDSYLTENLARLTLTDLSVNLGVGRDGVNARIRALGLKKPRVMNGPKAKNSPRVEVSRICQNPLCNSVFEICSYEVNRGRGTYCSNECTAMTNRLQVPDKETLQKSYENGLSTNDLALEYGISKGTVYNLFKAYGIQTRTLTEAYDTARAIMLKEMGDKKQFKSGLREDLQVSCRSQWEAGTLRWLTFQEIEWDYEPHRFKFPETRGARSYLPDIWLPVYNGGTWIEVKGRLMSSDKTRIRRFRQHYPEEFARLVAIPGSPKDEATAFFEKMEVPIMAYYRELDKEFKTIIPHWDE